MFQIVMFIFLYSFGLVFRMFHQNQCCKTIKRRVLRMYMRNL